MVRGRIYDWFHFLGIMLGSHCLDRLFYLGGGVIMVLKSSTQPIPWMLSVT